MFWSTQYQQNPQPAEGELIKRDWLTVIDLQKLDEVQQQEIRDLRWNAFSDTALEIHGDESAVIIAAKWGENVLIKRVDEYHQEFPELLRTFQAVYNGNDLQGRGIMYIEKKSTGGALIQSMKRNGLNVTETETPTKSKPTRVKSIQPELETNRVFILKGGNENLFIERCTSIIDDEKAKQKWGLVDCLYYAVKHTLHKRGIKTKMLGR